MRPKKIKWKESDGLSALAFEAEHDGRRFEIIDDSCRGTVIGIIEDRSGGTSLAAQVTMEIDSLGDVELMKDIVQRIFDLQRKEQCK